MIDLCNCVRLKMHIPSVHFLSILLMIADGFTVKGPSGPLVVPLGGSVLLPCSVDSLSSLEDLEVEWKKSDSQTLIHLYQDGDIRPEVQHEDYHDRAHFFTENIKHGNFSLLMKNVTVQDEGQYTCTVHSGQESGETVVEIKDVGKMNRHKTEDTRALNKGTNQEGTADGHETIMKRLIVSGSNKSISVYVGDDVTLNCSVDSHIPSEHIEEVSWKKRVKDEHITVLLYESNKIHPDSSDEQYRDRVEFFSDEIHRGNFSLRLKRVRTEDKGLYMCHVFAGRFSDNTTIVLQQLGFSGLHIMVLILCVAACGSAVIICCLIYCTSQNTEKPVKTLGYLYVFLPNIIMFVAFVLWGVTEGFLYETILCCALCFLRPLMLIYVAPYSEKASESRVIFEFVMFTVVYFSVLFKLAWDASANYTKDDRVVTIVVFAVVILLFVTAIIYRLTEELDISCSGKMCDGEVCEWMLEKLIDVSNFSFYFLPSLQFTLLFFAFGAAGRAGVLASILFPLFFFLSFGCLAFIKGGKKSCSQLILKTSWLIFMLIMNAVMSYFFVTSLENEKDVAGWTCTAVFLQVLWMITLCIVEFKDLDVPCRNVLYVFGSVGVVLIMAVALMTELILKTVNGDRALGDLRVIVYSSEGLFTFTVLIFIMFEPYFHPSFTTQTLFYDIIACGLSIHELQLTRQNEPTQDRRHKGIK
ncbi:hypothetical protein IRJ41_000886 [Triplophysa rosa]|uniref:Ig-like domain-containing protein n=1 Tax=Triplophysa rosa TaxID=992332 RepID=A0A9W7WM38_TRIRA|nr:hypothetical protein IRJ41_000886 [Triplophysa rosa]